MGSFSNQDLSPPRPPGGAPWGVPGADNVTVAAEYLSTRMMKGALILFPCNWDELRVLGQEATKVMVKEFERQRDSVTDCHQVQLGQNCCV